MSNNVVFNGRPEADAPTHRGRRRRRRSGGGALALGLVVAVAGLTAGASPAAASPSTPTPAPHRTAKPLVHVKLKPIAGVKAPASPTLRALQAATPMTGVSASLPDFTCTPLITLPSPGGTRSCDLYALAGAITVPGITAPVPIWGFSQLAVGPATIPGPTLIGFENEDMRITLHNLLPSAAGNLSLEVPAAPVTPDVAGIATGGATTYDLGTLKPGTYVYEAGATPNSTRQVAMGLSGMLVIRPSTWMATSHTAYHDTGSTFSAESPLEVSELDTAFNANPQGSDLHTYRPNVFLVNGHAFDPSVPMANSIPVSNTDTLLLRYANLGIRERSISVANARQIQWASDTNALPTHPDIASIYLSPVQTADAFTTVDPGSNAGTLVPVYDQGHHFTPSTAVGGGGLGGMIGMLDVVNGLAGAAAGPVSTVDVTPKTEAGPNYAALGAAGRISSCSASPLPPCVPSSITGAEWFLDAVGAPGAGTPITGLTPSVGSATYSLSLSGGPTGALATALAASPLPIDGEHTLWVHGQDSHGWGVVAGDTFTVDMTGPPVVHVSVHSTPTNEQRLNDLDGTSMLDVVGSAKVSLSDYMIQQAELCVDTSCSTGPGNGNGAQLALITNANGSGANDPAAAVIGFSGGIDLTSLSLADGTHTLYIHACEDQATTTTTCASRRWGPDTTATFVVDTAGPATTITSVVPDPNNGFQSGPGNVALLNEIAVTATLDDTATGNSAISKGEVFLIPHRDAQGNIIDCTSTPPAASATGTGAEMVPAGGAWNVSAHQVAYAYLPLQDIASCPEGKVRLYVHAEDQAANWGPYTTYDLTLDKTVPVIDSIGFVPVLPTTATSVTITIQVHDPVSGGVNSNIAQAEYFLTPCTPNEDASCFHDPGVGNGTQITIPSGTGTTATLSVTIPTPAHGQSIYVRVRDAAGNWTAVDLAHPVATF